LPKKGVIYLVEKGRLNPVEITFQEPEANTLAEALLSTLFLQGTPDDTEIPSGTTLNGVDREGSVAIVDVSGEFEQAAPPRSQALRIAQVVYTLTERGTGITAVRFEINGVPQVAIGDVDLRQIAGPVTRDDFAQFDPDAREEEASP
jgi:spore germination protein GerM